jgi:hypothetical protein
MIPEFEFKGQPLTEEQSKGFIGMFLNRNKEKPLKEDDRIRDEFPTQIFLKRISAYELGFEVSNFFFAMSMMTFATNPGKIMLLLRLCYQYHKKTRKTMLGINEWGEMFPWGTPTEEEMESMWDSQKKMGEPVGGNMLDNPKYWRDENED